MGILSGLEGFGLGGLANVDIFGGGTAKEKEKSDEANVKNASEITESDLIFSKSYTCPCCDGEFKSKTVKVGKARLMGTDEDLRPKYETIDMLKYDVVMCPNCGYTALSRFFPYLTSPQAKLIKINISQAFKNVEPSGDVYTYDEAIERYKMALANAIIKRAKPSEKAYICLKLGWIYRGKAESLDPESPEYEKELEECKTEEDELLRNAMDGFLAAVQSEAFPMCGMDESTVNYLIAVLSLRFGQLDVSAKLISGILTSPLANKRMKDRARSLKDTIVTRIKSNKKG